MKNQRHFFLPAAGGHRWLVSVAVLFLLISTACLPMLALWLLWAPLLWRVQGSRLPARDVAPGLTWRIRSARAVRAPPRRCR